MSNLLLRTVTGAFFLVIMVCCLLLHPLAFLALFLVIMMMAMKEFYEISLGSRFRLQQKLAFVAGVLALFSVFGTLCYGIGSNWLALPLIILLLIPVFCIFDRDHKDYDLISLIYAGMLYIALPVSLVPHLAFKDGFYDGKLLLALFIIIWVSDIGAYCIGSALGQKENSKKLAPSISPKKSWWGFWGGVILGTGVAVGLYFLTWLPFNFVHCLAIGVIVCVFGVCGDLVESLWKRRYGVKDSGNCIPGHGGMLDRFDSALIAVPAAAAYMALFGLI